MSFCSCQFMLKGYNSSPKNDISFIIYSPSCHSKPLWLSFFISRTLKVDTLFILWKSMVTKKILQNIFFCVKQKETKSYRFGMT